MFPVFSYRTKAPKYLKLKRDRKNAYKMSKDCYVRAKEPSKKAKPCLFSLSAHIASPKSKSPCQKDIAYTHFHWLESTDSFTPFVNINHMGLSTFPGTDRPYSHTAELHRRDEVNAANSVG